MTPSKELFPNQFLVICLGTQYSNILYEKPNTSNLVKKIYAYLSDVLNIHE